MSRTTSSKASASPARALSSSSGAGAVESSHKVLSSGSDERSGGSRFFFFPSRMRRSGAVRRLRTTEPCDDRDQQASAGAGVDRRATAPFGILRNLVLPLPPRRRPGQPEKPPGRCRRATSPLRAPRLADRRREHPRSAPAQRRPHQGGVRRSRARGVGRARRVPLLAPVSRPHSAASRERMPRRWLSETSSADAISPISRSSPGPTSPSAIATMIAERTTVSR